jgi:hypothetical protein
VFVLNLIFEIIFWTAFVHLVLVSIGHYCCRTLKTFYFFYLFVTCAFWDVSAGLMKTIIFRSWKLM